MYMKANLMSPIYHVYVSELYEATMERRLNQSMNLIKLVQESVI